MSNSQTERSSRKPSKYDPRPDCGIGPYDIQKFMQNQMSEAVELSWVWHQMEESDFKEELGSDILQSLVSVYMLQMWSDMAFNSEASDEESQEEDDD